MTAPSLIASLGAVFLSAALLGLEGWVVAIAGLGYVVSGRAASAGTLAAVAATLAVSAIVWVGAVVVLASLAARF